jgi:ubiquinone/menaquinone biosynthesis C-methylase UbiE
MLSEVFYELFSDIPRQGPGSDEYTRKAYMSLPDLALQPNILDVGCGSGMQTLELARISTGTITALDNYQPFLDDLRRRAQSAGLDDKIDILNGSMFELPFARGTFDLIWSEGAIFIIGFEKGLREWKAFIRQGGYLVVSELSWIKPDAPDELRTYLEGQYPAIKNIAENMEIIRQADYDEVASFVLPESGWWDDFYNPLQRRIDQLRHKYAGNLQASMVLDDGQLEIDMYKKYSPYYGYVFYLMQTK